MNRFVLPFLVLLVAVPLGWVGYKSHQRSTLDSKLSSWIIATQTPAPYPVSAPFPTLDESYPPRSRIVALSLEDLDAQEHVLSGGLRAAGAPALSPNSERMAFAGKDATDGKWGIYETVLPNGAPKLWISMPGDCGDPAYLSDNRIVFARQSDKGDWALFTVARDRRPPQQITFGADSARYPTVLHDGRILFSREQTSPNRVCQSIGLFTVNPDGTLLDAFTESHSQGEAHLRASESPGSASVTFIRCAPDGLSPKITVVSSGLPNQPDLRGSSSLQISCIKSLEDGTFLAAGKPAKKQMGYGIYRLSKTNIEVAFDNPEWNEIEVLPIIKRKPPRGRPLQHDPLKESGELVCYDVRRSDGTVDSASNVSGVAAFQLETESGARFGPFALNDDGAFYLRVPSETPFRVSALNRNGTVQAACNWIWVRSGEKRACFGCHEGPGTAPVNRELPTLTQPPLDLVAAPNRE